LSITRFSFWRSQRIVKSLWRRFESFIHTRVGRQNFIHPTFLLIFFYIFVIIEFVEQVFIIPTHFRVSLVLNLLFLFLNSAIPEIVRINLRILSQLLSMTILFLRAGIPCITRMQIVSGMIRAGIIFLFYLNIFNRAFLHVIIMCIIKIDKAVSFPILKFALSIFLVIKITQIALIH